MKVLDKIIYDYLINIILVKQNTIKLSDTSKLDDFVKKVVARKKTEAHHKIDHYNEASRWRTGIGGELALEKFLNKKFVDFTVGNSNDYYVSDLSKLGLDVGIKTVEIGKYPIIFKHSKKPEIIILRLSDDTFNILGLAKTEDLNEYQDDEQILSPSLKARGTKTAFTGLHKIKPFKNFEELLSLL